MRKIDNKVSRDQSEEEDLLFLVYCETCLKKDILEAEFNIDGYTCAYSHWVEMEGESLSKLGKMSPIRY